MTLNSYLQVDAAQARLGQLLFYDPLLSGNRNISCGTCHAPEYASTDGLALGFGEGGVGLGLDRVAGQGASVVRQRQSRNAPGLWNLGLVGVQNLFHDGRVELDKGGQYQSPAGAHLPSGLDSLLAVQALFPMIARTEMAGDPGENDVADAVQDNVREAWRLLAKRVSGVNGYVTLFRDVFADIDDAEDVKIQHIANAIGAFVGAEWRAMNTPFDRFLFGDQAALNEQQKNGMSLFFGKAKCSQCHSGALLSDQKFHAIGLPQFGPGLTRRFDPIARDVGRMAVTNAGSDAYRFRTPMLRNAALTGPYGHNGAYRDLDGIVRHHLEPRAGLRAWMPQMVDLPTFNGKINDFGVTADKQENVKLLAAITITPRPLSDQDVASLVAFLNSLTDTSQSEGRLGKPPKVPSGIPVD